MKLTPINIQDYSYDLPESRIASYPLSNRDNSKLLVYNKGNISHRHFNQLPDNLPPDSTLFFNNTRVIPARLFFTKDTGALIEVFLLQPIHPTTLLATNLSTAKTVTWKCTIGNLKKWGDSVILTKQLGTIVISAKLVDRVNGFVEFSWAPEDLSFAEIVHAFGAIPLPPYIKRDAEGEDVERYQTVYSAAEGAVAAPTAGLHFTDRVLESLKQKGISTSFLTLHVSAGTFMPVKVQNALDHDMHTEQILVTIENIEKLIAGDKKTIAVGTTAMRTLESVYWFGVKLISSGDPTFVINKLDPYISDVSLPAKESLLAVLDHMKKSGLKELAGQTSIFIFPGYRFRICHGLITNFHQPGSTLLLLIAALVGPDWKKIYEAAIQNDYRFLSYGDSSLLIPS